MGNFIRPDAYSILPRLEKSPIDDREQEMLKILFYSNIELSSITDQKALIINDHMVVNAVKRDFHKNDLCWTVNDNDVDTLLSNV